MHGENEHPLLMALKRKSQPAPPRFMDLKAGEVRGANKPGDSITVNVSGTIKSIDDEGRVVLAIERVNNGQENKEKEQKIMVTTQESHAP